MSEKNKAFNMKQKVIYIFFKRFSVFRNCLRPEI